MIILGVTSVKKAFCTPNFAKDKFARGLCVKKRIRVLRVWGTNYFSLFVSYRFTSNKTQLTEFPE